MPEIGINSSELGDREEGKGEKSAAEGNGVRISSSRRPTTQSFVFYLEILLRKAPQLLFGASEQPAVNRAQRATILWPKIDTRGEFAFRISNEEMPFKEKNNRL